MNKFIKIYNKPNRDETPSQTINIDSVSHFNTSAPSQDSDFHQIFIYFKDDPTGMNYKAKGYITRDDLEKLWE